MRSVLIGLVVVVLVACADTATPDEAHAVVACDPEWIKSAGVDYPDTCEAACELPPNHVVGDEHPCDTRDMDAGSINYHCADTIQWRGLRGCCLENFDGVDRAEVYFAICQ